MPKKSTTEYTKDYGGPGKVIVLLHGFLGSSAYWRRLQPRLSSAGYRVITIDLLGFGRAPKPKLSPYAYAEHVRHIDEALSKLNITGPFILVGHSMGALLAMRFSRLHAERIGSLILLHPPLFAGALQAYQTLRATGAHYRFLLDSKFRMIAWGTLRLVPGATKMRHTKQSRENSLKHVITVAEGLHDLKRLPMRTLLVLGSKDRKEYIDNMRSTILGKHISVSIEPVDHHSPLGNAELVFQKIHTFTNT